MNNPENFAGNAVNAINEYYNQVGLASHYNNMARDLKLDDTEELERLSQKHLRLAQMAYDYIMTNFKQDIEQSAANARELMERTMEQEEKEAE